MVKLKSKYIKEEKDFEDVDRTLMEMFDEQLIYMERLYGIVDRSEMRTQKLKEKALLLELRLKSIALKFNPFFFEERRSYLLRNKQFRLR